MRRYQIENVYGRHLVERKTFTIRYSGSCIVRNYTGIRRSRMPLLQIDVFGALHIRCGDAPIASVNTTRLQSLFAYLVLHCDTPVSRERFAFLLWPDSSESQARTNLRQLLHHLRRALPPDCCLLESDHHTVQWRHDPSCPSGGPYSTAARSGIRFCRAISPK
jgi:hypothetical protein